MEGRTLHLARVRRVEEDSRALLAEGRRARLPTDYPRIERIEWDALGETLVGDSLRSVSCALGTIAPRRTQYHALDLDARA